MAGEFPQGAAGLDVAAEPDQPVDGDGDEVSEETMEELVAIAEAEATAAAADQAAEAVELAAVQRELATEQAQTRAAVARYRDAVLAAEPELPPELVSGETLEELETSLESARRAVAQIRERLSVESEGERGFPVGAPARGGTLVAASMTSAEKIAYGLEQRAQAS